MISVFILQDVDLLSENGIMFWTINDYERKLGDAERNIRLFLDSPPFLSSKNGYKMCCRVRYFIIGGKGALHDLLGG